MSFTPPSRSSPSSPSTTPARLKWSPEAVSLPSTWQLQDAGLIQPAGSEDDIRISEMLMDRVPDVAIAGIYATKMVQRGVYDALKATMIMHGTDAPEERDLWHGTSWTFVPKILKQGFNRSFAGRHGTLLGNATYFSSDPRYSLRFCDKKGGGQDGTKILILSRVLVGRYCKGSSSDVEPPSFNDEGDRYDTTVDSEESPSIFAVFRDFQAVPLFLVEIFCA